MDFRSHLRTTGSALRGWFVAMLYDCLIVGAMWLVGLLIIRVPLAIVWAVLGGLLQFVPNFGPMLAPIGPAIIGGISGGWMRLIYVLILYAIIAVTDGLVLQPYLMKRTVKVPIWASILAPIVLGIVIPFWGVLLAPPLLAVIYTYRHKRQPDSRAQLVIGKERFPVGTEVQVKDEGFLRQRRDHFQRHPILDEQIAAAGQTSIVTNVGLYDDGRDVLYKLRHLPGIWHEECLQQAPGERRNH